MTELKCRKCGNPMTEAGISISGNTKYRNWHCEICNHKEIRCIGLIE